jgi:hypothetical protein
LKSYDGAYARIIAAALASENSRIRLYLQTSLPFSTTHFFGGPAGRAAAAGGGAGRLTTGGGGR